MIEFGTVKSPHKKRFWNCNNYHKPHQPPVALSVKGLRSLDSDSWEHFWWRYLRVSLKYI